MLDNKLKCKICNSYECNTYKALTNHLIKGHKVTVKDYYDTYIKTVSEGICIICGRPTKFRNLQYGYRQYCSNNCSRKDSTIYDKAKETNVKKYGVTCTLMTSVVKDKARKTKKLKYGSEYYCNSEKSRKTTENKTLEKYRNIVTDCKILEYKNKTFKCQCNSCNRVFNISESLLYLRHSRYNVKTCTYCNPVTHQVSGKEKELLEFLTQYGISVIKSDRSILSKNNELDLYIPAKNIAIEFDGLYWHSELYKDNDYHLRKTEECEKKGIQLIHIFEDEWIYKQDIVKSRLCGLLGLNTRIYARKCSIREVSYEDSAKFLDKNHIQGNCMSKYRYGLYYNGELVSLMTFGQARFNKGKYELLRFCNKLNTNVIGGASRLFTYFLRMHMEIHEIISYADRRWSKGNLYEKLGFKQESKTIPAYYYIIDNVRHNRVEFQKHKLVNESNDISPNMTEHEIMLSKKIYRIYDCGNLKYLYVRD